MLLDRIQRDVEHSAKRARNCVKLATGIDAPRFGQTPKELVWRRGRCELWRYVSNRVTQAPPLVFVFSLISRSYIVDIAPGNSFIEHLQAAGFDVLLVDWAPATAVDAEDRLEDYVDGYLPDAIDAACRVTRSDEVNLLGYCSSGLLTVVYAARHPDAPVRSLTNIATPVDFSEWGAWAEADSTTLDAILDQDGNVPGWILRQFFRLLRPTGDVRDSLAFLEHAWNDDYVAAHRAIRTWGNDQVPFPGAAARQVLELLIRNNALVRDEMRLGGEGVRLGSIRIPALTVIADRDHIVPPRATEPLHHLLGSVDKHLLRLHGGHIGLVIGKTAAVVTVPRIIEFLHQKSETVVRGVA